MAGMLAVRAGRGSWEKRRERRCVMPEQITHEYRERERNPGARTGRGNGILDQVGLTRGAELIAFADNGIGLVGRSGIQSCIGRAEGGRFGDGYRGGNNHGYQVVDEWDQGRHGVSVGCPARQQA